MKRYRPLFEDKNYKNAIQYLTKHFSSQIKIPFEKYDSVIIDFDGEKYNPPNTYSYTPSGYKK
jgi:hypothetical protein